jgi:plasmid stabilization system protein ParE
VHTFKVYETAEKEIKEACKWYDARSVGLGNRFIEEVQRKFEIIKEFPERYPIRKQNYRETPLKIFPYLIVYTFDKNESLIIIKSVFHASRNPSKKYSKK